LFLKGERRKKKEDFELRFRSSVKEEEEEENNNKIHLGQQI
jgi:hypothetical protein